ncbi:hypothetical protein [Sphingomonas faeni]|uniref:hypothetical protein n=1 Tax=Sphingomonas faeni TaxID=185950 RepID=UPI00335E6FF8
MFVRKSTYDAMHAEAKACSAIAQALAEQLNKAVEERDAEIARVQQKLRISERRYEQLDARLAVFTAPRARDAKGHFISAKGASA